MKMLRMVLLVLGCLGYLTAGVANAALPCCCISTAETMQIMAAPESTDTNIATAMPCHGMQEQAQNNSIPADSNHDADSCNSCGCVHLSKLNIAPPVIGYPVQAGTHLHAAANSGMLSELSAFIYIPPRA